MPFYKISYKGFSIVEADTPEEAVENLHNYLSEYDEEETTEIKELPDDLELTINMTDERSE